MRAALYARVSTLDQQPENQLAELRRYAAARGWEALEYTDHGVSGSQDRRRALDALLRDARRRRFGVVVCWRLDRLGRNLRPLRQVDHDTVHSGLDPERRVDVGGQADPDRRRGGDLVGRDTDCSERKKSERT